MNPRWGDKGLETHVLCQLSSPYSGPATRDEGRLVGVRRGWRRRRVAGKVLTGPHAPACEMQSPDGKMRVAGAWMIFWFQCLHKSWRSPPGAPSSMVSVGKRRRRKILPAVSVFWRRSDWSESLGRWGRWLEWNTVTGRFPGVDDTGNWKELGFLPWLWYHVERERKKKDLNSHSCNIYLQLRNIYIYARLGVLTTIHVTYINKERLYTINTLYSTGLMMVIFCLISLSQRVCIHIFWFYFFSRLFVTPKKLSKWCKLHWLK